MQRELFIGVMSGTSLDGIDAVLVSFDESSHSTMLLAWREYEFPDQLLTELRTVVEQPDKAEPGQLDALDHELGHLYAKVINDLLAETGTKANEIAAIGCHGQTVDHQPNANRPFSLQLGDGAIIAAETGITTVNDFRSADIALGGQGAPLAPAFHAWAFKSKDPVAIVNIGGIANITVLTADDPVLGYDTGPGNTLLDLWSRQERHIDFDENGQWGATGQCDSKLLKILRGDPYLAQTPPKSTGRELFNLHWLNNRLAEYGHGIAAEDVQATLTEFTAATIADAVQNHGSRHVWVCGGGAKNSFLMSRIAALLENVPVQSTDAAGIPADWVEAIAFAWLASARIAEIPAGMPSVTGATAAALLGKIHTPAT